MKLLLFVFLSSIVLITNVSAIPEPGTGCDFRVITPVPIVFNSVPGTMTDPIEISIVNGNHTVDVYYISMSDNMIFNCDLGNQTAMNVYPGERRSFYISCKASENRTIGHVILLTNASCNVTVTAVIDSYPGITRSVIKFVALVLALDLGGAVDITINGFPVYIIMLLMLIAVVCFFVAFLP